jgi:hypothetical protein
MATFSPSFSPTYAVDSRETVVLTAIKRGYCSIHTDIKIRRGPMFNKVYEKCNRCEEEHRYLIDLKKKEIEAAKSDTTNLKLLLEAQQEIVTLYAEKISYEERITILEIEKEEEEAKRIEAEKMKNKLGIYLNI